MRLSETAYPRRRLLVSRKSAQQRPSADIRQSEERDGADGRDAVRTGLR